MMNQNLIKNGRPKKKSFNATRTLMGKTLIALLLALTSLSAFCGEFKNAMLPEGKAVYLKAVAKYEILLPQKPSSQEKFAAKLLNNAILRMTGINCRIINEPATPKNYYISIGATTRVAKLSVGAKLKKDGYQIREHNGNCYLTGGSRRGPINAVIALMEEDLGWRYYSIFVKQKYPELKGGKLKVVPRCYSPPFDAREIYIRDAWNTNWALLNRMTPSFQPMGKKMSDEARAAGGTEAYAGAHVHTFWRYAPDKKLIKKHPEYFALSGRKRHSNNICLSNPDTVKIVAANAIKKLDSEPGTTLVNISQNDGKGVICQCDKCRATTRLEGSPSGTVLRFVNAVADIINKKYPKVKVSTLAYLETYQPPRITRPKKNVIIVMCTDTHAWFFPYYSIKEPKVQNFAKALKAWTDLGAQLYIWEYSFGHTTESMTATPNFDVLTENLRYFAKNKSINGMLFQDNYCSIGNSRAAMKNWIFSKMIWNPNLDLQALERDFCLGYYGNSAGEFMQQYNELLRYEWKNYRKNNKLVGKKAVSFKVSPNFLDKANKLLNQAHKAAKNSKIKNEIGREQLCLLYQRLNNGPKSVSDRAEYKKDIEKMRSLCKHYGISNFQENFPMRARFRRWTFSVNRPPVKLPTPNTIQLWLDVVNLPNTEGKANASIVKDPDSESGYTIMQPPYSSWTIQYTIRPETFLNATGKYIVRARIKLGKIVKHNKNVMHIGLYSYASGMIFNRKLTTNDFKSPGYQWIKVAEIDAPRYSGTLFFAAAKDCAVDKYYVNMVELIPKEEWEKYKQQKEKDIHE